MLFDWRVSLNHWRNSFTNWRLHASFTLETFNNFLQSESWFFKIHLKLNGILFWDFDLLFESILSVCLEFSDKDSRINVDSSQFIFFIRVLLCELKGEEDFSVFVEVRKIKVELRTSKGHDVSSVSIDEIGFGGYFVFVKLLQSFIRKVCYLWRWRIWI